jgi:hypothetical protein
MWLFGSLLVVGLLWILIRPLAARSRERRHR